jgi:predicted HicB family RNase H-like nuclease
MKRQAEGEGGNETNMFQQPKVNPKERIDSEKVAQEAIDKARNSLELREFLDQQKDPIEEARKALDKQMADLDEALDKNKIQ